MFRCAVTGEVTKPGEPCTKIVVQTRGRHYVNLVPDEFGTIYHEGRRYRSVESGGTEIVREILVSPAGLARLQQEPIAITPKPDGGFSLKDARFRARNRS
jgi:hypothetical protein